MRFEMRRPSWPFSLPALTLLVAAGCNNSPEKIEHDSGLVPPGDRPVKLAMGKLMKGPVSLKSQISAGLSKEAWGDITPKAKEFKQEASKLRTLKQPKGPDDSWQKQTGAFADMADELEKAVQKKNKDAAEGVLKKMSSTDTEVAGTCNSCHNAHRGKAQ